MSCTASAIWPKLPVPGGPCRVSGTYWILPAEPRTAFAAPLAEESAPAIPATRWQSWHWYNCMRSPARRTICKQPTFFIRTRGTRPLFFFDRERGVDTDGSDYIYNQAHCPLTAQTTAVGHAVRGVYLYAGAAAVAEHTGNRALQAACETLWQDLCRTKLYVTGALGQTAVGEAFGPAYYLPNDLAYGESCASAGLVFFAQRLYRCHPHAAYAPWRSLPCGTQLPEP